MTESEWLTCAEPERMLEFLKGKAGNRKSRLVGCAWCRTSSHALADAEVRYSVDLMERHADGLATENETAIGQSSGQQLAWALRLRSAYYAVWQVARMLAHFAQEEAKQRARLLRDIFGNPFRPVAVDPFWLTPTVLVLTRNIYEERVFDRMPILADALVDAGCDNDDILNHCRQPNEHVRGCWVVDLILDKN